MAPIWRQLWLTSTNAGVSEVCEAALRSMGVPQEELDHGYMCDLATKSSLRIVAKAGILVRLSRNFDKVRGFVVLVGLNLGSPWVRLAATSPQLGPNWHALDAMWCHLGVI